MNQSFFHLECKLQYRYSTVPVLCIKYYLVQYGTGTVNSLLKQTDFIWKCFCCQKYTYVRTYHYIFLLSIFTTSAMIKHWYLFYKSICTYVCMYITRNVYDDKNTKLLCAKINLELITYKSTNMY